MGDLADSIEGLFESGKYADATICCEGTIFKVHCAIVCSQSNVLAKMVDGQFMEATLSSIELPNDELPVVTAMMRYFYTGNYFDEAGRPNGPTMGMPESTAEDIPGLKILAKKKFEKAATSCWNNPLFSAAAKKLWDNTVSSDRMLRDVIAGICRNQIRALLDRGEFRDLLSTRGGVCLDVLILTLERNIAPLLADETVSVDNNFDDWGSFASARKTKKKKGVFQGFTG
ncbi:hypothetical protein DL98DRAFT_630958 [Cadophora sp. DSE1049]|nr:hypothetical protein DL98DRAFT_630958 [Cadophora sp. DSE1049]